MRKEKTETLKDPIFKNFFRKTLVPACIHIGNTENGNIFSHINTYIYIDIYINITEILVSFLVY